MADKNTIAQMLEHLVNDEQQKAEELFHEYVVAKSREIYEGLIESEMKDDDDEDEDVEEGFGDMGDDKDDDMDDMGDDDMDDMGGDPTDDLETDIDAEIDDGEEKSEDELFMDLQSIVDELQDKFNEIKDDDMGDDDMDDMDDMGDDDMDDMGDMDDDEEMKDDFDLDTVREYVEKVPAGHGVEKKGAGEGPLVGTGAQGQGTGTNAKSIVAGKNDMGGTSSNILRSDTANDGEVGKGSKVKGSALNGQNPKEDNAGNINVPGGKAGKTGFTHKEPGHGSEKKGAGENAENKQSLFRGRRK